MEPRYQTVGAVIAKNLDHASHDIQLEALEVSPTPTQTLDSLLKPPYS
jgi:hypothetical protein